MTRRWSQLSEVWLLPWSRRAEAQPLSCLLLWWLHGRAPGEALFRKAQALEGCCLGVFCAQSGRLAWQLHSLSGLGRTEEDRLADSKGQTAEKHDIRHWRCSTKWKRLLVTWTRQPFDLLLRYPSTDAVRSSRNRSSMMCASARRRFFDPMYSSSSIVE